MERMTHDAMLQVGEAMGRVLALLNSFGRPPLAEGEHPYIEGYRAATVTTNNRIASAALREWLYHVIGENGDNYATADRMARGDAPKPSEVQL
jgi:hypothetical protein